MEGAFQDKRHWIASRIQARYKGYKQHNRYLEMKAASTLWQSAASRSLQCLQGGLVMAAPSDIACLHAALILCTQWRRLMAKKKLAKLKVAQQTIKLYVGRDLEL